MRYAIIAVCMLVLGGCAVPKDEIISELRSRHIIRDLMVKTNHSLALCFGVESLEAEREIEGYFINNVKKQLPNEVRGRDVSQKAANDALADALDAYTAKHSRYSSRELNNCGAWTDKKHGVTARLRAQFQ